ncbi:MAG: DUF4143 domain-containing protein [Scrofimicrobium sp.]
MVIDGPKAVGKTDTATRLTGSQVFLDADLASRSLALADPSLVLEGAVPRLLDEWQVVPSLWNAVRHEVYRRKRPGQFILTGSASPSDDQTRHTGTGRFSWLRIHPLTLTETGHSTGAVSLRHLLSGQGMNVADPGLGIHELIERIISGGWPVSQGFSLKESSKYARAYLDQTARVDVSVPDGPKHDALKVSRLLRSLARNAATEVSIRTLATDAGGSDGPLHADTVSRYLTSLQRIFVLEIQEAWGPGIRTRTPLRESPKRHLADSSLTLAALRIGSADRLLAEPETLGLLFESLVIQQLRAYASLLDAEVVHYRDKSGLECDAILQNRDGDWIAVEVKLGAGLDAAAHNLKKLRDVVDQKASGELKAMVVLVPTGPSYLRQDGVQVVALSSLGL